MNRQILGLLGAALLLWSCGGDSTGPDDGVQLSVLAGDLQFGLPNTELAEPFQAMVVKDGSNRPAEGVNVQWKVTAGSGTVVPATSTTDARGIATARLRLGSGLGAYRVEASAPKQIGSAAAFSAEAVLRPEIESITPPAATAGQTVVITGRNFNSRLESNAVRFDRIRGRLLSATPTRIEVVVPGCVPSRTVAVDVLVGSVASATASFAATGTVGSVLTLAPGEARLISDPAELACLRLPGGLSGARYLLATQNAATAWGADMRFELASYSGAAPVMQLAPANPTMSLPAADAFELRLRTRERQWVAAAAQLRARAATVSAQQALPAVGAQRSFNVLNSDEESVSISAEVVAVSQRAIIYQDVAAPAGGFTQADFVRFGQLFDDPIYTTDEQVFGTPSDIDDNDHIIILFTPRVNALTDRGEGSYIAGYFYGCDLVERVHCNETNRGEIFYSLVPDPQGKFGDVRTATTVFRAVQPVLAHELQHMINFALRGETLDALWLSEGMAHTAEDVVGDVFAARGDPITAREFQRTNYARASRFLSDLPNVSLIAEDTPGTLELRGGAWLLLRHLRAHYGGNTLLRNLTMAQVSGTQNVTTQTGQSWSRLLADFAVALYQSSLSGSPLAPADPHHTFGSLPVRAGILSESGAFPLQLGTFGSSDGAVADALPSAGTSMFLLTTPSSTSYPPVNLVFAGALGGPFSQGSGPQLMIYRTR